MSIGGSSGGGPVRTLRRLSILVDVQDVATARLAGINAAANKTKGGLFGAASAGRAADAALAGLAVTAGAGLIALGKIVSVGSGIQKTFATIGETMSATTEQMSAMTSTASDLGRTMPVSMGEAAGALEQFAYAGFEAEEAMDAVGATVELAVAGSLNMAEAAKTTGQMMNAFNIEADAVAQTTAALTSTFANSATTIDNLSSSMQYSAATMNQLGFGITEVNSALGTMADAGLEGTRAGTAINQAFNKLTGMTGKVERALSAVGLQMDDLTDEEGNMLPMVEVMEKLKNRLEEAGIEGQGLQRWLVDMFGQRGARAMGPLLENVDEFGEKLEESALAQLKSAYEQLEELDDADAAEMAVLFNAENVDEEAERLEEMSEEEIIAEAEGLELPGEPIDAIKELREQHQQGAMEIEEMAAMYQHVFDLEEEAARQLADMTASEEVEIGELNERLEEATTQGELAAAQMDTVGGRLRYMRGSIESAAYMMYQGFAPALETILDLLISLTDSITEHEWVLKTFGAALLSVTTIAGSLALVMGTLRAVSFGSALAVKGLTAASGGLASAFPKLTERAMILSGRLMNAGGAAAVTREALGMIPRPAAAAVNALTGVSAAALTTSSRSAGLLAQWRATAYIMSGSTGPMAMARAAVAMLGDAIRNLTGGFARLGGASSGVVKPLSQFIGGISRSSFTVTALVKNLTRLSRFVGGPVRLVLLAIIPVLAALHTGLGNVGDGISWVVGAFQRLISAAASLYSWWDDLHWLGQGLIIGLTALINPAIAMWLLWDRVIAELFDTLGGGMGIFGAIESALAPVVWLFSTLAGVIDTVAGAMYRFFGDIGGELDSFFEELANFNVDEAFQHVDNIGQIFSSAIITIVGGLKDVLVDVVKELASWASEPKNWAELGDSIGSGIAAVLSSGETLMKIVGAIALLVPALLVATGAILGRVAYDLGAAFVDWMVRSLESAQSWLTDSGVDLIKAIAKGMLRYGAGLLKNALVAILGPLTMFLPSSDAQKGPLSNLTEAGENIPKTLASGILGNAADVIMAVYSLFEPVIGLAKRIGSTIGGFLLNAVMMIVDGVKALAEVFGVDLNDVLEDVLEGLRELFDPFDTLFEKVGDLLERLEGLDRMWFDMNPVSDVLGWISDQVDRVKRWAEEVRGYFEDDEGNTVGDQAEEKIEEETGVNVPDGDSAREQTKEWILGGGDDDDDSDDGGDDPPGPVGPGSGPRTKSMIEVANDARRLSDQARTMGDMATVEPMVATGTGTQKTRDIGGDDLSREDVTYIDDRRLNLEMSPTVEVQGGMEGMGRNITAQIEEAMTRAREAAMDDFIDFMLVGGPAELADDSAGSPDEAEDGFGPGGEDSGEGDEENFGPGEGEDGESEGDGEGEGDGPDEGEDGGGEGDGEGDGGDELPGTGDDDDGMIL